jgi:hypothetical protein
MLKTLRTLTAVAAIAAAGLPLTANATLVTTTLDFEGVGTLATHYFDAAHGFTTVLGTAGLTTAAGAPGNPFPSPANHSLYNDCSELACSGSPITLDIDGGLHSDGTAATAITFDLFVADVSVIVELQAGNGTWSTVATIPSPAVVNGWVSPSISLVVDAGTYTGLRFTGSPRLWAIDNLSFRTDDGGTTTNVPEPASLALVALALAGAAGTARRREKR